MHYPKVGTYRPVSLVGLLPKQTFSKIPCPIRLFFKPISWFACQPERTLWPAAVGSGIPSGYTARYLIPLKFRFLRSLRNKLERNSVCPTNRNKSLIGNYNACIILSRYSKSA
ncbi:hypothetical protein AVEN_110673-1 [Araneus ventricosus]|uniref:Uncharacterized protein n=1 Tax=Araneus ventricosus TaxID=182803 RepID=A0A4Y2ATK5_ARAVE|nr:hypothetical protein AVEN_110673-1 [Araneus ventricosus]